MERLGLAEAEARRKMHETDANRAAYIQQLYRHDWCDPDEYDLIVNTGRIGYEAAAEMILRGVRERSSDCRVGRLTAPAATPRRVCERLRSVAGAWVRYDPGRTALWRRRPLVRWSAGARDRVTRTSRRPGQDPDHDHDVEMAGQGLLA